MLTTLFFKLPTTNVDGTSLDTSTITGVKIGIGAGPGAYTKFVEDTDMTVDANGLCEYPLASLGIIAPGKYYVVCFCDVVGPGGPAESAASQELQVVVPAPTPAPNPPSALSVK